ncbi:hypothetical protein BDF14DRAFT_1884328 [Spinellus fusiger]|nr:hypothetical protein BDF14DRAFT_1884328 [Spinellus fusiger]
METSNPPNATQGQVDPLSFWARLSAMPLVQEGLGKVQHYCNKTPLSRYALQQAETTLTRATEIASPYAAKYRSSTQMADDIGCKSLDMIEKRITVVRQSTDDLVELVDGVRGRLSSLTTLPAPINQRMMGAADNIESLVDKWLPTSEKRHSHSPDEEEQASLRFYRLANDVSQRLVERMPYSRADLTRLTETNQLLHDTAAHISRLNTSLQTWILYSRHLAGERVQEFTHHIKGGYDQTQEMANQRIQELTAELVHRLDHASTYLKDHRHSLRLPVSMQSVLDPLVGFATHEYDIIRTEALREDLAPLQKATSIVHLTQAYVLPMLQTSIDSVQEQIRYYTVYASTSKDKVVHDLKSAIGIVA